MPPMALGIGGSSRKDEASALPRRSPVARIVSISPVGLRGQADGEPDRSRWRSRRLQLSKPTSPVKPHGAPVVLTDRQVRTSRTHVPHRSEPALHQPPSDAAAAQSRYKVDVQMRGIKLGDHARRAARMMYAVAHVFVVCPSGGRCAGRIAIELSEARPPFGFQPNL